MNKYMTVFTVLAAAVAAVGCDKDTEGLTQVTYYADIQLKGDVYDQATAGQPYTDPGFTATMQGANIDDQVKVSTRMDVTDPKPGFYSVTYTAVNPDGFEASATRYVLVSEAGDKASGYYETSPESYREAASTTFYGAPFQVIVYGDGAGTYHVSDFLGGWYQYRAGYGPNYAAAGTFTLGPDGAMTLKSSAVPGWGDSLSGLENGKFDAPTSTFSWQAVYAGMKFNVTMSK